MGPLNRQMVLQSKMMILVFINQSWVWPIPCTVTIWIRDVLRCGLIFLPSLNYGFFQFPFVWGHPSTPLRLSYPRSLDWKQKNNTQICDLKSTWKGSRKFRLIKSGFIRWWINAFKGSDVDLILDMCWWKILPHFRAVHQSVLGKG